MKPNKKNTLSISVFVPEQTKPLVKVFPWNGIDYKKLIDTKERDKISVSVVGEKSFKITVQEKDEKFYLECNYFE